jgi:hypothetical protein
VTLKRESSEEEMKSIPLTVLNTSEVMDNSSIILARYNSMINRPIARQRLGKHIPMGANALNSKASIARERINKHA